MSISETTIAVVLDQHFGHHLWELAQRVPVWVRNSETNSPIIQAVWEKSRLSSEKTDVTSFSRPDDDPEQAFLNDLDTMGLHHPSWLVMEAYGVSRTPQITEALQKYGVESFRDSASGFIAARPDRPAS